MQLDVSERELGEINTWIGNVLTHTQLTVAGLARECGVPQSVLSRLVRRETTRPTLETLSKLAAYSPIAVPPAIQNKLDVRGRPVREQGMNNLSVTEDGKIPVWGVHPVQRDGEFRLNMISIAGHLPRQRYAENNFKLAAFYAPDDTMAPRWMPGEPVVYDRAKAAKEGDFGVLRLTPECDPNDEETYIFRRIGRRSDGFLRVYALRAAEDAQAIPIDRILEVRHVLDWSDFLA